jgi:chitinase
LIKIGVPRNKLVVGGAFYARVWEDVADISNGLYQSGKFKQAVDYRDWEKGFEGFEVFWDKTSQAPYRYHRQKKLFATHDDERSLALKTRYAIDQNGIMFWELSLDKSNGGLLDAIIGATVKENGSSPRKE